MQKFFLGKQNCIELGNLNSKRDWGYAKEYAEGMYRMLQADKPDTFVLATNKTNTVREFVSLSFKTININILWQGENENEIGINENTGEVLVKVNRNFYRPDEADVLVGEPSKAKREINWKAKTNLQDLVKIMVERDIERNILGETF